MQQALAAPDVDKQIRSASNWALTLGTLKLVVGVALLLIVGENIAAILELTILDALLTLLVGGLMVVWGTRIRKAHPKTLEYLKYLIVLCSITLLLAVLLQRPAKIGIDALAIATFVRARKRLKDAEFGFDSQTYHNEPPVSQPSESSALDDSEQATPNFEPPRSTASGGKNTILVKNILKGIGVAIAVLIALGCIALLIFVNMENNPSNEPRLLMTRDLPSDSDAKIGWSMGDIVLKYGAPDEKGEEGGGLVYIDYTARNDWVGQTHHNRYYFKDGEVAAYRHHASSYGNAALETWFKQRKIIEDELGPPAGSEESDEKWEAWWGFNSDGYQFEANDRLLVLRYVPDQGNSTYSYMQNDNVYMFYYSSDFFDQGLATVHLVRSRG